MVATRFCLWPDVSFAIRTRHGLRVQGLDPWTHDLKAVADVTKPKPMKTYNRPDSRLSAGLSEKVPNDPDLAAVVDAWPDLPPAIRRAVLALIETTKGATLGKDETITDDNSTTADKGPSPNGQNGGRDPVFGKFLKGNPGGLRFRG